MTIKLVPYQTTKTELVINKSRFITTATPCFSVKEAKLFFKAQKKSYSDANHNIPAYIIGHGKTIIMHSGDDGEPSGTAGKPILNVLKGSKIGDIAVTVTRYFGGIKLGTGGLVKAYTISVQELLKKMPTAVKTSTTTIKINLPYKYFDTLKYVIDSFDGNITDEEFLENVTIILDLQSDKLDNFAQNLQYKFDGLLNFDILSINPNATLPMTK